MTQTTIREIRGEEMQDIIYWLSSYGFQASPPLPDKTIRHEMIRQREGPVYFALFEDKDPVACMSSTPMVQNVRGRTYQMGGIFEVLTHPAARRKGYSRRLMLHTMAYLREEKRPFSCLYPFRESFYERMGYVTFPLPRKAIFSPLALQPLLGKDFPGEVKMMLIGEGYDIYRQFLKKMQMGVHGMALFEMEQTASAQRNTSWLALAKAEGDIVGLMVYDLKGEMVTKFNFRAIRFYYKNSLGRHLLLDWIARHVDQAETVEIWLPPFEHPETWLSDLKITMEPVFFSPMGRVLDVEGVSGMQTGPGQFTATIMDPQCTWNEGTWSFTSVNGRLQVDRSTDASCELSIHALSALAYGTNDPDDFALRGWGKPAAEIIATMRAMFPAQIPYLHEIF